ncbi:ferritin family protein [Chloroflexota bacterium]
MTEELDKTLGALKYAIQMEIDGKAYYLKASEQSSNDMGKKLLKSLAEEEDIHLKKFQQIYDALSRKQGWPAVEYHEDDGKALKTIFARESEKPGTIASGSTKELEAVQGAINMEVKSYDYYTAHGKKATGNTERAFFGALAAQERHHQLVLLDYYEYLKDPAAYFVEKEHHSLDGG